MKKHQGVTLIELMIVLIILGILAAIAYPSYSEYVKRTNESAAQQFMLDVANLEEQYMLDARQYTNIAGLGVAVPTDVSNYYTVTAAADNAATPPSYTITVTPKAGTRQAGEDELTLNSAGQKTREDSAGNVTNNW